MKIVFLHGWETIERYTYRRSRIRTCCGSWIGSRRDGRIDLVSRQLERWLLVGGRRKGGFVRLSDDGSSSGFLIGLADRVRAFSVRKSGERCGLLRPHCQFRMCGRERIPFSNRSQDVGPCFQLETILRNQREK